MQTFEEMKYRILFQQAIYRQDDYGGQVLEGWDDVVAVWAKFEEINSIRPQIKVRDFSVKFYKFTIRNNCKDILEIITNKLRIFHHNDQRYFYVESIHNICHKYLEVIGYERLKFKHIA